MNVSKIEDAIRQMRECQSVMGWLQEHSLKREEQPFQVRVELAYAGACPGAKEVQALADRMLYCEDKSLSHRLFDYAQKRLAEAEAIIRAEASGKEADNG